MSHPTVTDSAGEAGAEQQTSTIHPMDDTAGDYSLFHPKVLFPFLALSLIWGSTWLVIRDQISPGNPNAVPESWSITYRFTLASAGMFLLTAIMRKTLLLPGWAHFFAMVIGILQFALNFNLVYVSEHYLTSGLVAVLFALLIIPNAVLGRYFLHKQVLPSFWLGSTIATAGGAMLIWQEYQSVKLNADSVIYGALLVVGAIVSVSCANVMQATRRIAQLPILTLLAWSMLYGMFGNALWALLVDGAPQWENRMSYFWGVGYLAIVGSVMTFPLYFNLIRLIGPGKAAYTSVFIPIVAMLLSTAFEGYVWTGLAATGAALAVVGLLVAMQASKPSR